MRTKSFTAAANRVSVAGLALSILSIGALAALGCSELLGVPESSTGSLQIMAAVEGESIDRDPDGFLVTVDDGSAARLPATSLLIRNLSVGSHSVKISGVALNCSVAGTNPQTVEITRDIAPLAVVFAVTCQPNVGTLKVSAVTTGEEVDEKGYSASFPSAFVSQHQNYKVPANGSITIPSVRAGLMNLSLDGVPQNCDYLSSPVRPTQIVFGTTTEVTFTLRCVATGRFQITTATTGVDFDLNGYYVEVSLPSKGTRTFVQLPASGTSDLAGLPPGDYSLRLSDIANNCDASRPVFSAVTLVAHAVTPVAFDVTCTATKQIAYATATGSDSKIGVVRSNAAENFQITSQTGSNYDPDWSPDGSRIAFASDRDGTREIYAMDSDGRNVVRLTSVPGMNYQPAWSPNGKQILFVSEREGNPKIYLMDADGQNSVRLTNDPGNESSPSWSPDGRRVAFQSDRDGAQKIWIMNSDGTGVVRLPGSINGDVRPAWSPDGRKIAFSRTVAAPLRDIYTLDIDGSNLTQITFNYSDAFDPAWSPDGLQIAFSAKQCDDFDYYYSACEVDILLARTDGKIWPSTPVLSPGYNPAWRR